MGRPDGAGYGVLFYSTVLKTVTMKAHRAALEEKLGRPMLPGMKSCHTCDNPPCCLAEHLFEGTQAQNSRDAAALGRWGGARPHRQIISNQEIILVCQRRAAGEKAIDLAEEFGISRGYVDMLVRGSNRHRIVEGAAQKPRGRPKRDDLPQTKVSTDQMRDMPEMFRTMPQREIAKQLGVSPTTICMIKKQLDGPDYIKPEARWIALDVLKKLGTASPGQWHKATTLTRTVFWRALRSLVDEGWVIQEGHRYHAA